MKRQYSPDILNLEFEDNWLCETMNMAVDFDFDKHSDILLVLKATVSEHLPNEQSEENIAHSEDADEGALVNDIQ